MLRIRLMRFGRRNDPHFRVVVVPRRTKPGKTNYIENLGNYDPRRGAPVLVSERIQYWLSQGAKASPTVHNLLVKAGITSGPKIAKHARSKIEPGTPSQESASPAKAEETPQV